MGEGGAGEFPGGICKMRATQGYVCFPGERAFMISRRICDSERYPNLGTTLKNSSPSFWNDEVMEPRGSCVGRILISSVLFG